MLELPFSPAWARQIDATFIMEAAPGGWAVFSADSKHRYLLGRRWAPGGPVALFGMQNPSKAGASEGDPTITRCVGFARRLGAHALAIVNMGARVATDPDDFIKDPDPIGAKNLDVLRNLPPADFVIAGWGALSKKLRTLFAPSIAAFIKNRKVSCLGKTKAGDPRHPLYLKDATPLIDWR